MTGNGRNLAVERLLLEVEAQPLATRDAYLADRCGSDLELLEAVLDRLLRLDQADGWLQRLHGKLAQWAGGVSDGEVQPEPPLRPPVDRVGPWRLSESLGHGGMGSVWLGIRDDATFEQEVAVKILHLAATGPAMQQRFDTERRILARLDHPHIARLLDGGITDRGLPWLAMERIKGIPVDQWCDWQRLPIDERIGLFGKICEAVEHAHRKLVVHRDLKPSNILVDAAGTVKLLDFGIAKVLDEQAEQAGAPTLLTRLSGSPMTPAFASPEQLRGEAVTTTTDVYALGVLLYLLLCGRLPRAVRGVSPAELVRSVEQSSVPPPSRALGQPPDPNDETGAEELAATRASTAGRLQRRLAGELDTIVLKAMHPEGERRYTTVNQFALDLERWASSLPISARPDTLTYRARKFVARHVWGVAVAVLLPLLIIGSLIVHSQRLAIERDKAVVEGERNERLAEVFKGMLHLSNPDDGLEPIVSVRELITAQLEYIHAELAAEPSLRLELLGVMGEALVALNDWHGAREVFAEAVDLAAQRFGAGHGQTLELKRRLALSRAYTGDLEGAETLFREALEGFRIGHGEESEAVAATWYAIGYALSVNAPAADPRAELAGIALNNALDLYRRIQPGPSREQADTLHYLGRHTADLELSLALVQESVAMTGEVLGKDHFHYARRLGDLAMRYDRLGRFEAALETGRLAWELHVQAVGEQHPQSLTMANNLAGFLRELGRYEEALDTYLQNMAIIRQTAPEMSMRLAFPLNGIGTTLINLNRHVEAVDYLREVVEITAHNRSAHEPQARRNLARALAGAGQIEEARLFYASSIELFEAYRGTKDALTLATRAELAALAD